jgi:hypothetical protein
MRRNPYRLHAVLVHDGRSVGSGHYWAYLYERDADRWILYNDQQVSVVVSTFLYLTPSTDAPRQSEEDVLSLKPPKARVDCQPTVYCLVYLSDKLVQDAIGMKLEPLPHSLGTLTLLLWC